MNSVLNIIDVMSQIINGITLWTSSLIMAVSGGMSWFWFAQGFIDKLKERIEHGCRVLSSCHNSNQQVAWKLVSAISGLMTGYFPHHHTL